MTPGSSCKQPKIDTQVNANNLINDPSFLAYKFNFQTESVAFLPIDRDEIRKAKSLKRDDIDPTRPLTEVPLSDLVELLESPNQDLTSKPPRFIFHTAFCASTFLSRCLDVADVSVSLREPQLLLDAANAKRLQWRSSSTSLDFRQLPKLALMLLQKHAIASEKLIIKPINSVNNIIPELLQITGSGKSLMLYTDARNFVLSALGKGEGGKQTIRSMFDLLRCDFEHLSNLQLTHAIHMTDLRVIMTLWRLQIEQAEQALQKYSPDNIMASLYGEELIRNPLEALRAVSQSLELGISNEQIAAIANSDKLSDDAKNEGKKFSLKIRQEQHDQLMGFFGDDLNDGLQWLNRNNPGTELHPELSGALQI